MGRRLRAFEMCVSERRLQSHEPSREVIKRGRKASVATAGAAGLPPERELRTIIDDVLRLARNSRRPKRPKCTSTRCDDSLTRFANNAIHQNVAERGLTVSIRTVVEGRTARATTNRIDEDSLRRRSSRRCPWRVASRKIPGCYRCRVSRNTAKRIGLSVETARLRRKIGRRGETGLRLAIGERRSRRGFFHQESPNRDGEFAWAACGYRETHAEFSITMQESPAASWAKANSLERSGFDPQKFAAMRATKLIVRWSRASLRRVTTQ